MLPDAPDPLTPLNDLVFNLDYVVQFSGASSPCPFTTQVGLQCFSTFCTIDEAPQASKFVWDHATQSLAIQNLAGDSDFNVYILYQIIDAASGAYK